MVRRITNNPPIQFSYNEYITLCFSFLFSFLLIKGLPNIIPNAFVDLVQYVCDSFSINLNMSFVAFLLVPFQMLLEAIDKLSLDLSAIKVTCEGYDPQLNPLQAIHRHSSHTGLKLRQSCLLTASFWV
jgi:hypothetical protein